MSDYFEGRTFYTLQVPCFCFLGCVVGTSLGTSFGWTDSIGCFWLFFSRDGLEHGACSSFSFAHKRWLQLHGGGTLASVSAGSRVYQK